jgi:hypothetical protein
MSITDPGPLVIARGQEMPSPPRFPQKQVRLKVTRALAGIDSSAEEITIETGLGGGDCGYHFERGLEYIVYGYKGPGGGLFTGICSPTRPIAEATPRSAR